jgi:hypothetical protein
MDWSFKIKLCPLLTLNILVRLGKWGKSICPLLSLFFLLYFLSLASVASPESHSYQPCEHLLFRRRVVTSKIITRYLSTSHYCNVMKSDNKKQNARFCTETSTLKRMAGTREIS